ncbi:MAG: hypothetical protein AAGI30_10275 [Planctomycetota bacterium]
MKNSPSRLSTVRRAARQARRRLLAQSALDLLGPALVSAFGACLAVVALAKWRGDVSPWWTLPVAAGGVGVVVALVLAWVRRLGDLEAAMELDQRAELNDRLATAMDLESQADTDPFAALAVRDAVDRASGVRVSAAMPLRLNATWRVWPALATVALLAAGLVPQRDAAGEAREAELVLAMERERASDDLDEALRLAKQAAEEAPITDLATEQQLAMLDRIREELESAEASPEEARAEASTIAQQLANELDQQAEALEQEQDAFRELARDAAARAAAEQGASELTEALERGDFAAAQQELDALQEEMAGLSEEERAQRAEELAELAEQLEQAAHQRQTQLDSFAEQQQRALADRGLSEQSASELGQQNDASSITDSLESQGLDPEEAQRLAERVAHQNRQRQAEQRATNDAQQLGESLKQAAENLKNQPEPQNQSQNDQQQQQDQQQQAEQNPQQSQQSQQQQQQQQQNQQSQSQQQQSQRDGQRSPNGQQPSRHQQRHQQQSQQSQNQQQQQQQQQQNQQQQQSASESRPNKNQEKPKGQQSQSSSSCPDGQCQGLSDASQKLGDRSQSAGQCTSTREQADSLRESANRLSGGQSAGGQKAGTGAAPDTWREPDWRSQSARDMDLRRGETDGPVISAEINAESAGERDPGAVSRRDLIGELRDSAAGAEQAVEERTVPARYRNVERYFRRAIDRAEDADAAPPPAEDAADVEPSDGD